MVSITRSPHFGFKDAGIRIAGIVLVGLAAWVGVSSHQRYEYNSYVIPSQEPWLQAKENVRLLSAEVSDHWRSLGLTNLPSESDAYSARMYCVDPESFGRVTADEDLCELIEKRDQAQLEVGVTGAIYGDESSKQQTSWPNLGNLAIILPLIGVATGGGYLAVTGINNGIGFHRKTREETTTS